VAHALAALDAGVISRSWLFVSCVTCVTDLPALAAVDQAASALQEAHVLR